MKSKMKNMGSYKTGGMVNPNAKAVVKPASAPKKKMAVKKMAKKK
jgi:hypothetical protein